MHQVTFFFLLFFALNAGWWIPSYSSKEDPKNEQILYAGTDNGLYITFNLGESWQPFSQGLPETGVNDIYINDSNGEMTVATLGRGIYRDRDRKSVV